MPKQTDKTNAVRLLIQMGIPFELLLREPSEAPKHRGEKPAWYTEHIFKTLVTQGHSGGHYVFILSVMEELDLKKAAAQAGEKSVAMIPQSEMVAVTGYERGGCSPIGMKRAFSAFLDEGALLFDKIHVSAGKIGLQLVLSPEHLLEATGAALADLTQR